MDVRRWLAWAVALAAAVLLSACATGPRTIEVPRDRIEAAFSQRFPHQSRIAGLFAVRIGTPHLTLLPDANRMQLDLSIDASDPSMRNALLGDLTVSFGLRYEPRDRTVRLVDARVDHIDVPQWSTRSRELLKRHGPAVVAPLLENSVLHTLRPEDLARASGMVPGAIRVTRRGIAIELVAAP